MPAPPPRATGQMIAHALDRLRLRWDVVVIVALAAWILAPVPLEVPRSQDHTVHLARAWMVGQNLAGGHVASWSSTWFFGFPAGELYPVLGDLAVNLVRALSLGLLPWASCYAIVFWLGYVAAATAFARMSRTLGLGPWPGVIAAAMFLLDPGETREGGYRFTVFFGVWLLPLAVAWTWCAIAELHANLEASPLSPRRMLVPTTRLGAALLAHPITLPLLVVLAIVCVLVRPRAQWSRAAVAIILAASIAFAAAAWFVLPMLAHRAWMANFGALHLDLSAMFSAVLAGQWAANMSPALGWTVTVALAWALWRGGFVRIAAVASLLLWLLASRDAFWVPRLDWLSASFGMLQYQRFVLCAKPGLYLCAGAVFTAAARAIWIRRAQHRAIALAAVAWVACVGGLAIAMGSHAREHEVGAGQLTRGADAEASARFERDWQAYAAWAREEWAARDRFFRFAYETASRHGHGLADAPVYTGAPAFKIGSTPGETFVHRVESARPSVLDRLRVRYLVTVAGTKGKAVAQFGTIRVIERPVHDEVARVVGGGQATIVEDDPDGEGVVVDVAGAAPGARLEFAIAGYPRWELLHDGEPVEWIEVPVVGDRPPATQAARRAGAFVAGPRDRTEPSEPMLLAAPAKDGRWELRYRHLLGVDVAGFALAAMAVAMAIAARRHGAGPWIEQKILRVRPWWWLVPIAAALVLPISHWLSARESERHLASARLGSATEVVGVHACAMEIERVIGPAACVVPGAREASATFTDVIVGEDPLLGFLAVDDGTRERGRGQATLEISVRTTGDAWQPRVRETLRFDRGRVPIAVTLADLGIGEHIDVRLLVRDIEGRAARVGFDLALAPSL